MKRETKEWSKIAEEELKASEHLFKASLYRMVCYHAQQAVEKILKALPPLSVEDAVFLNSVYRARYPAALGLLPTGEPTKEDADRALQSARKMYEWLKEVLG